MCIRDSSKSCSELATHSYINSFFADKTVAVSTARAGNVIGGGDFANDRIIPDCVRAMAAGRKIGVRKMCIRDRCGVDAIASIPPIYFHLPNYAIADYWNAMSAAAPNTEFIIYNIPQLAGTALTMPLLNEMLKNPNVIAVKNSSMPTQDIQMFKDAGIQAHGADGFAVFNGPDEQFVSGLSLIHI